MGAFNTSVTDVSTYPIHFSVDCHTVIVGDGIHIYSLNVELSMSSGPSDRGCGNEWKSSRIAYIRRIDSSINTASLANEHRNT